MKQWPNKKQHESYEINEFIKLYKKFNHGRDFDIVEHNREKPDNIVRDKITGEYFGIELTSVYLDDRSVPEIHMKEHDVLEIPYLKEEIENYKLRIKKSIEEKIGKAKNGYDTRYPLILSVYPNEYCTIHMDINTWKSFVKENNKLFDSMAPFIEIVFWNLVNNQALSVKPEIINI